MENKLTETDEYGLFPVGYKIPYYSIILTEEEAKKVEGLMAHIYEIDGKQLIDIRDENKNVTGKKWLAICFFGKK